MIRSFTLACLALFAGVAQPTSPHPTRDVSAALAPILREHELPGMVGAIVEGWQTVALGAVGVRQAGGSEEVHIEDRFHLGSCTKSMTATLCAILVERGTLSWKSTIGEVFPEVQAIQPVYRSVTLEQLLTHTGGVPKSLRADGLWGKLRQHQGAATEARLLLLQGVVAQHPQANPGTQYIYSNGGYAIAGHMVEKVSGKPWEQLMSEEIFAPLEMNSAGFGAPGKPGSMDEPRGHSAAGIAIQPGPLADNPAAIGPAGTVHSSIADWARYVALHLRGAQGDAKLITAATFKTLHRVPKHLETSYARGWVVAELD